ncbi:glycosyltransferase [Synechococcus sp. UW140]|uniref:glycosyltransferase n=1 Tax=Synechococcus sp. UW140 TaxID=368503 RepID=UPI00210F8830|nr:glycosyltransferase [Synechococcus sp. UW140]
MKVGVSNYINNQSNCSLYVVPPWSPHSIDSHSNNKDNEIRKRFNISMDNRIIVYTGNIGLTHPLEPVIEAFYICEASQSFNDFIFLIVGDGLKKTKLFNYARELDLLDKKIFFLDRLVDDDFYSLLSISDMSVVALDAALAQASLPSKTFTALSFSLPILSISDEKAALSILVTENDCGFSIQPDSECAVAIALLLQQLSNNHFILDGKRNNAFFTSQKFTPKNADIILHETHLSWPSK